MRTDGRTDGQTDRQTDSHDETNSPFRNFANAPKEGTGGLLHLTSYIFFRGVTQPIVGVYYTTLYRALASSRTRLLDHTQLCVTVGRTPLNE